LPVGVQIVGPRLADLTTIRFAELLEREYRGVVPPPDACGRAAAAARARPGRGTRAGRLAGGAGDAPGRAAALFRRRARGDRARLPARPVVGTVRGAIAAHPVLPGPAHRLGRAARGPGGADPAPTWRGAPCARAGGRGPRALFAGARRGRCRRFTPGARPALRPPAGPPRGSWADRPPRGRVARRAAASRRGRGRHRGRSRSWPACSPGLPPRPRERWPRR